MEVKQVYSLLNNINNQMLGKNAIEVVDTSGLVSMGNYVLSSSTSTENFLNTLVGLIGKTIISYRKYTNKLSYMMVDDFTFGAILQKIKVAMPSAVEDKAFDLVDGRSVDQYEVKKPTVNQKLFYTMTPYSFFVTIQEEPTLEEAFRDVTTMGAFVSAIFGEVLNKIELSMENLGRICLCNFIANTKAEQRIHLLSEYKTLSGQSTLTKDKALLDANFLRYAIGRIMELSEDMTNMSTIYNSESYERHTPVNLQKYVVLNSFQTKLETVMESMTFNKDLVSKLPTVKVPYWQAEKARQSIKVQLSEENTVELDSIVAVIHDVEALGIYKKWRKTLTTPVNARGVYYNTFWHERQMWFNDMSENGIVFLLD